jgi:hypothetical protein
MPKVNKNKKQRLAQAKKEHEVWLVSMGYKGGKSLRGKNGRRMGIYSLPNLREGLVSLPPTSDNICTNGSKKESTKYTGDLVKGIATMHKSNAIPITSGEQAIEVSQMRRS